MCEGGRIPDGAEAEGHEQQDGHDAHGPLVVGRVAALQTKRNKLVPETHKYWEES